VPLYDFRCEDCGHQFEALVRGNTQPECPSCHSGRLERLLSLFSVNTPGTRRAHLEDGRRHARKEQREKAVAEHEMIHHHDH
jgi:putative FmdB family regulatory protein